MLSIVTCDTTLPGFIELLPYGENESEPGPAQVVLGWVSCTCEFTSTTTNAVRIQIKDRGDRMLIDHAEAFATGTGIRHTARIEFPGTQYFSIRAEEGGQHGLLFIYGNPVNGSGTVLNLSAGWSMM
jgi:hypothetical protein